MKMERYASLKLLLPTPQKFVMCIGYFGWLVHRDYIRLDFNDILFKNERSMCVVCKCNNCYSCKQIFLVF